MNNTLLNILGALVIIGVFIVSFKACELVIQSKKEIKTETLSINKYKKVVIIEVEKEAKFDVKWITNQ